MKRVSLPALIILIATMILLRCGDSQKPLEVSVVGNNSTEYTNGSTGYCERGISVRLIAGRLIEIGSVTCWIEGDTLYVEYVNEGGWVLAETHLAVAASLEEIPTTPSGNPRVGHFPCKGSHQPAVTEYRYPIDLASLGLDEADEVLIAAHADVQLVSSTDEVLQAEGAWSEGEKFLLIPPGRDGEIQRPQGGKPGRGVEEMPVRGNWAMYFIADVQQLRGLILWNKLGSVTEVSNSEIGADGTIYGSPLFLAGKFDNGLYTSTNNWVEFMFPNINHNNGCLECWVVPKSGWNIGWRVLFHGITPSYASIFCFIYDGGLLWATNDSGSGYSTVVKWTADWTIDTPTHMAFVWDVNNSMERAQLYRDGEKVGTLDKNLSWMPKETSYISVGAHCTGVDPVNSVIDNIKIWNYPKTDFSDRFVE
ncbi:MAG: LamG domain-containing protein [bacterium]|nr:MAG: LamG domain-containing protein [bacterium]